MNNEEFCRLAEKYINMVYRIVIGSVKNSADAEDIVQNTFEKLLRYNKPFNDDEHAKRWLIRVAVNECNYIFRRRSKIVTVPLEENIFIPGNFSSEESELLSTIRALPNKYSQVLHLYYFEEYSTAEISGILNISEANVRKRLQRARELLSKNLKETGNEQGI